MQMKHWLETKKKDFQVVFLPFAENSVKRVTFSCQFKEGIWVKFVKNRMIWIECKKLKKLDCSKANEVMTENL